VSKRILVTGATGFIGKTLVSKLLSCGYEVVGLGAGNGDIADNETLRSLVNEDIGHVFHLAGKTYVPDSWDDPNEFCRINVMGTINILEFCRQERTPCTFVSAYVYGHPEQLPIQEESLIRPSNPYALSKRMAEEACEFYATAHGMTVTTLRPFNVYGVGQDDKFLIPSIVHQALNNEVISIKDLTPKRDYVYLEDLITALMATMGRTGKYSVYNVGSGVSLSVQEVIDTIQEVAGTNKKIVCDNKVRNNELMDVVANISRAGKELGWRPEYSFRAGIEFIIRSERGKS